MPSNKLTVRGSKRRVELKFQKHIINSYKRQGGVARKWASEWQVGVPDIIASLPLVGVHLIEVKHRPEWESGQIRSNPLDPIQISVAKDYINAGGLVIGAVVFASPEARGSCLTMFDPICSSFECGGPATAPYVPGLGFDVRHLLAKFVRC